MPPISVNTVKLYLGISKPRIGMMVSVTTTMGFVMAGGESIVLLFVTLLGTLVTCAGSAALNAYLERDLDRLMKRTCGRPLATGTLPPEYALNYGLLMVLSGVLLLAFAVNLLTAFLALLTAFLYVLVYTPLKRVTWLNTFVGAIPGALPPVGGWAAVSGDLGVGALALFLILFIWQHPHFFAIAWIYREDYARGGFKMLPVVYPDSTITAVQILMYSLLLIPVSLLPCYAGLLGMRYCIGAVFLGTVFLVIGLHFWRTRTTIDARRIVQASLIYLPTLLLCVMID